MIFSSAPFLLVFLPLTLIGYFVLQRLNALSAVFWLLGASLVFYSVWDVRFLAILIASMAANYTFAWWIERTVHRRAVLGLGVTANLGVLTYFKYAWFLAETAGFSWEALALPLGISFFTFQQIAHLVDVYRGEAKDTDIWRYALFVSFFPHLIAGPLTRCDEVAPQFGRDRVDRLEDFSVGLTLLLIGLVKKMVIADPLAIPADRAFDAAASDAVLSAADAWLGTICYSLQLYFDFSGYSDMAVGLARMVGVDFPINFASPYKALSITDFWRRWHITLSRFLRDYLYIPLGGSRTGPYRHQVNLLITMLLGGIWHGAGWTFIIWGALHGFFLLTHHAWRISAAGRSLQRYSVWRYLAWALTILAVVIAWVPFRAADVPTTLSIWTSMAGLGGTQSIIAYADTTAALILLAASISLFAPNAYEWLSPYRVGLASHGYPATQNLRCPVMPRFLFSPIHAAVAGIAATAIILRLYDVSAFIYFQF